MNTYNTATAWFAIPDPQGRALDSARKTRRSLASAGDRPSIRESILDRSRTPVPRMVDDRPFDRKVYRARPTTRRLRTGPYLRHSEAQLVVLTAQGDPEAYCELVERFQNAARNRALGVVKDYQAAEDVTQDAFVKAYNALKELEDPKKFAGWFLTIVQHTALDYVRARRDNVSLETMKEQGYEAPRESRGEQIEKMEEREEDLRVLEALNDLRDDYKEIILLKHVEGLSYKDSADRLGMSVSAVGEKLSRVRTLLKRRLEKKRVPRTGEEPQAEDE